jgi:surfactin synthase thioesterase subunit
LIHALPDDQFLDRVRQLGGTPAELLADTRMMAVFLPVLRADFAVNDAYAYRPERPLGCPITACGGLSDADVDQNGLMAWQQQTTGPFSLYLFRGGHFYLQPSRDTLLRAVDNALHRTLMRDRRAAPAG